MTNGQTMHTLPGSSQFPTTRWTLVVAAGYDLHVNQFLQKKLYTTAPMIQTVLQQMSETVPAALNANPNDFIDNRYAQLLDQRGLYAELDRTFKPR
jgi:hypothetical protein